MPSHIVFPTVVIAFIQRRCAASLESASWSIDIIGLEYISACTACINRGFVEKYDCKHNMESQHSCILTHKYSVAGMERIQSTFLTCSPFDVEKSWWTLFTCRQNYFLNAKAKPLFHTSHQHTVYVCALSEKLHIMKLWFLTNIYCKGAFLFQPCQTPLTTKCIFFYMETWRLCLYFLLLPQALGCQQKWIDC